MLALRFRVEQDLTYAALAAKIGMKPNALYKLLNRPQPHAHDRTLYKIRKFLTRIRSEAA